MAVVKAFKAIRPKAGLEDKIAALPYDVYNRKEAYEKVKGDNLTFLRIDRPETQFDEAYDMYKPEVYEKAKEMLLLMKEEGSYIQSEKDAFYIYELIMDGRSQNGIVACASIDDYLNNVIKKHENTREEKELDRIRHVDTLSAQTGPIFLAYRHNDVLKNVIDKVKNTDKLYGFTSEDGITHNVWVIDEEKDIEAVTEAFYGMDSIYIADGHHRAASAVKVGLKRRSEKPDYDGTEEFNYFLSVLFQDDELMILPYNRVVKDLNGHTEEDFLSILNEKFNVTESDTQVMPKAKGEFGMYLNDKWYVLKIKEEYMSSDPVKGLDVSLLQDNLLSPVLGIIDPRTDKRIDFVGGIRGLDELEKRANSDMKLAFSMYPTSIGELFSVADNGLLMPPKSTWFEPKLRSGIFIHEI